KSQGNKITFAAWLFLALGTAFFVSLLVREGVADVFTALRTAGWGVLGAVVFQALPLLLDALGWRPLFPPGQRPRLLSLWWMRWVGASVNNLVPVAQVGGDLLRARLAGIFTRSPMTASVAAVIVNITANVFTQVLFTFGGFLLLMGMTHQAGLAKPAIAGVTVSALAIGGFYAVQRMGGIRWVAAMIGRVAGGEWRSLARDGAELDAAVKSVYARKGDVAKSAAWALVSWIAGAGEIWIALKAMGRPAGIGEALAFETMSQGFRTAVFFVPGALGVQEGAYLFVAGLLGVPGEVAMALALIRRVRELAVGIPAIIAWQVVEGRRLRQQQQAAEAAGGEAVITPFPVPSPALEPVREPISAPRRTRGRASRY
ncbi:MAG TPA: flippase-like domain-containing protein, partial [Chthoniobacteraceae bacterium]|nr:flippase-like domain-containing protein [Chthoniobacteraceae bacterium]